MAELDKLLTVVVPVKNEETNLPGCLENIRAFEHIVVVDSGSTDGTRALVDAENVQRISAGQKTIVWLDFKWNGQFPKKRNWVLRNHRFETSWVLFLDADERVPQAVCDELTEVLPTSTHDVYWLFFDNWFMGRMLKHGDVMRKTALLRIGAGEYERIEEDSWSHLDMEILEQLIVKGTAGTISARMEHHDRRSLENYYRKHEANADWESNRYRALIGKYGAIEKVPNLSPRQRTKYGNITKWWLAPAYFIVSYILKRGFLDGYPGYVFARGKMRYFTSIRRKILGAGK